MSHRDKSSTPTELTTLPDAVYDAAAKDGCDMRLFRRLNYTGAVSGPRFKPARAVFIPAPLYAEAERLGYDMTRYVRQELLPGNGVFDLEARVLATSVDRAVNAIARDQAHTTRKGNPK
jgi:hypothetical protein